jgi:prepilin-type processing-associated H-X9-DG protein
MSTDLLHTLDNIPHKTTGGNAGVNALFTDAHVRFQTVRANPQAFSTVLWADPGPGGSPLNFRRILTYFQP